MTRWLAPVLCLSLAAAASAELVVGSKAFTEGIILGEVLTQRLRAAGVGVRHERALGDAATFQALVRGDIDAYAEYTGTLRQNLYAGEEVATRRALSARLAADGLVLGPELGFENSFALGMKRAQAAALGIRTISDLLDHPGLRFGFTQEFLQRGDGWPALRAHYGLPQESVRGMAHAIAYAGLDGGSLDVVDLYTTDAEVRTRGLVVLRDDRGFFPEYAAVIVHRADLAERVPRAVAALGSLADTLDADRVRAMNAAVMSGSASESEAAAAFLREGLGLADAQAPAAAGWLRRLLDRTLEHLLLVASAMALGVLVAVPLGVASQRLPRLGRLVLPAVSVLQTVPALALLALMVPLLGIGAAPAIAALFAYAMLPIVRNTHAGLAGIERPVRESAEALGLPPRCRLLRIDLPLAAPLVLAGVRTATVYCIGFATLGAFVGAGGYGGPILQGVQLNSTPLILFGAVPSAAMAVAAEAGFQLVERRAFRGRS
ncbi:glycine betaine ABC transporter substrate-binding protein [Phycisphaera mikurensis]|uniref:Putative ABC transporter substrate binding protein/permease protein n=1 Tax=Phycisphaera mikurensis (strain NBRC 102666 / KCTC 22515 / FYK2301M01) TaxID=1142394 RepID=I0IG44_PHYMF|nr:glycine betaine ABC transporter substrate-binding protein [Phycisphaera mikurensis]MBB6440386.1 osmoprotectant transport system permease protein [Phycisphaera mikurensis]BAM04232.1 putative ABC transporter substrate binding protein/permease protein [Phycisphaera mikurensis NBRC 102666]